ncbi:uncharacterized protein PAC_19597 [Phialocephala subalpina]|uniref:Arrestin-like N-terminal domain-containing protein n=1 Tax=Phialocephala subalpina TaxID=576137 RepID=A0A1L7XXG0_9HELO|nr:uncharacterized protein PAC_19597 [Phialocephala subalpina]
MSLKFHPSMTIRIILPEDATPARSEKQILVRHSGETIHGHLEIVTRGDFSFKICLAFEGVVRTWMGSGMDNDPCKLPSTGEYQLLKEVQHILSDPYMRCRSEPLYMYRLPFSFTIPRELISARSDVGPEFLHLCPSANLGLPFKHPLASQLYNQPSIRYLIRVKEVRTEMPAASPPKCDREREIHIMPNTPPPPPVVLEHFPKDYRTYTSSPIRTRHWRQPFGVLELSTTEPSPLNICTTTPRASTLTSLNIVFRPRVNAGPGVCPCNWKFTIRSYVRIRTFCSTQKFKKSPTASSAKVNRFLTMSDSRAFVETRQYCVSCWKRDPQLIKPSLEAWLEVGGVVDERLCPWSRSLVVPMSASKALLPTFLNPLSARQYALVLKVSVEGFSHRGLELVLPLQVIYWPDGMQDMAQEESDEPPPFGLADLPESSENGNSMLMLGSQGRSPPPYET